MQIVRTFGLLVALGLVACSAAPSGSSEPAPPGVGEPASEEDDVRTASTTLTVSLVGREYNRITEKWSKVSLDSLNPKLKAAGLPLFEKSITVGRTDGAKFEAVVKNLETANEKLGRDIEFVQDWDPSDYIGLCHTGLVSGVRKTVEALRGSMFSQYMGMPGYRYGATKKFLYGADFQEEFWAQHKEENADVVKIWDRFDTTSDSFLMLADGGQQGDGTELFAVLIPKCK